ncbi:MAG: FAD-dependent oxidoreductase, partial [Rubrivivax sp.]
MNTTPVRDTTRCCIAGGGPAGMMLGYLLARAGVATTVLEKHADFLRDFRGDTVHPSTLRVLDDLGLLDAFLHRPHQKLRYPGSLHRRAARSHRRLQRPAATLRLHRDDAAVGVPGFPGSEARNMPHFTLRMQAEVDGLLSDAEGHVLGVKGHRTGEGKVPRDNRFELLAGCTIACDGRHSTVRAAAGLPVHEVGAPIDVLWFRITRDPAVTDTSLARIGPGRFLVTLDRGDYWQCAFVIPKGGAEALQAQDIAVLRGQVAEAAPFLGPWLGDLRGWDDVKLLSVAIDRLTQWSLPGLLCIGDAAHAMSPVGGVGINLAI